MENTKEATYTTTIESSAWHNKPQIDVPHLRDIEFRILANMYQSKEIFEKVKNQIKADDFTFVVNKKIYEYLLFYLEENNDFKNDDSKTAELAIDIYDIYNINIHTTLKILTAKTRHIENILEIKDNKKENDIDLDIVELLDFSKKHQEVINIDNDYDKAYSNIEIEDQYGFYHAFYINGIISEIATSYIFHLPEELTDTFEYTFEKIRSYIQTDNYDVTMTLNEDNPEEVHAFCLRKNIDKIEQVEKLIAWANENKLEKNKIFN